MCKKEGQKEKRGGTKKEREWKDLKETSAGLLEQSMGVRNQGGTELYRPASRNRKGRGKVGKGERGKGEVKREEEQGQKRRDERKEPVRKAVRGRRKRGWNNRKGKGSRTGETG